MKSPFSPRKLFIASFLVLITTNVIVLTGIASNRSGEPDALVMLSERELRLPYRLYEENSGLFLRLQWRTVSQTGDYVSGAYANRRTPAWFDMNKLEELGFNSLELDYYRSPSSYNSIKRKSLPKEVFIVLENNGPLHAQVIKQAEKAFEKQKSLLAVDTSDKHVRNNFERAEQQLNHERIAASRLFAIDAGLEPNALRQKYQNRSQFIIAKGLVEPVLYSYNRDQKMSVVSGYIKRLSIERVHIPLKQRKLFDTLLVQNKIHRANTEAPRYQVELAYGQRLEPWVTSIKPLDSK